MDEDLDTLVRRVDEDRWLASRFAPAQARARLIAIYAVNYEIARTSEIVREPGIGHIRLAWWREALEEIAQGAAPRAHPVLEAYAVAVSGLALPPTAWDAMIEARALDLEASPFASWPDVDAYLDATAGNVMRLALAACGAPHEERSLIPHAARAWGYVGLLRSQAAWVARGRKIVPRENGTPEEMMERAEQASLRVRAQPVSSAAFPAIAYIALASEYLRRLRRDQTSQPLLSRQLRLVLAAATGRV